MHRTPNRLKAAMFARLGTSCGANSWCSPCRDRNAIGLGFGLSFGVLVVDVEEGVCVRIWMGPLGDPQGVEGATVAVGVKDGKDCKPVPPMTAIRTGSVFSLTRWLGERNQADPHKDREARVSSMCGTLM